MTTERTTQGRHVRPRVGRSYKIGTIVFLCVSLIVALTIGSIALSSTVVTVVLGVHEVSGSTSLTVMQEPRDNQTALKGTLLFSSTEGELNIDVPSGTTTVDDHARGMVTIRNTWTKAQPLAVKTRLRSKVNNMIYRTTEFVNVPSGGTVEVEVVADEKGAGGNIPESRFEIVALWSGLQEKIYGESSAAFTGGVRSESSVSQSMIDDAKSKLEDELLKKFPTQLQSVPDSMTVVGSPTIVTTITSSAKPGDRVPSFKVSGTLRALSVAVDKNELSSNVQALLKRILPQGEEYTVPAPTLAWTIGDYSERQATVELGLRAQAPAKLLSSNEAFKLTRFTGKTRDAILQELLGISGVKSAEVKISPFWSSRTPTNAKQVKVRFVTSAE